MRDHFHYPLEPMTPQQSQSAQKERQANQSWKRTSTFFIILAFAVYLLFTYWPQIAPQKDLILGGDDGVIQDGVYYIYGGGGMTLPNEIKEPIGLCAYTPGQEPKILVSAEDYSLDVIFPCWDVNSHGLYFSDMNTDTLYRMDLESREITTLYALPEAPEGSNPYIFPNGLWEDRIALICHDGISGYHLVLDCRTGEVLSKEADDQGRSWNLVAGDRILTQYQIDDNTDLRENGVSVLPQGHTLEAADTRSIGDAILVMSYPTSAETMEYTYQLFLADGRTLDLPQDTEETFYRYLAVSDQWLYYTETSTVEQNGATAHPSALQAMDLNTMESYLVSQEYDPYYAVTDGNWFYSYGDYTDCYQLEYNDQGIPCGLTLIEEDI